MTQPSILNQLSILNYTNSTMGRIASGTIIIESPANTSVLNSTLETYLPLSITNNVSMITTSGVPSNITIQNGSYVINWFITYLPAGQKTYAYYNVRSPIISQLPSLGKIQNIFTVPSPSTLSLQQILKIVNISVPTFYTGTASHILVHALYVGSTNGIIDFNMSASSDLKISKNLATLAATPGQYITQNFTLTPTGNAGTAVITLQVHSGGAEQTYTIPVIVLKGQSLLSVPITIHFPTVNISPQTARSAETYAIIAVLTILIAVAAIKIGGRIKGHTPVIRNDDRAAEKLSGIKQSIQNNPDNAPDDR